MADHHNDETETTTITNICCTDEILKKLTKSELVNLLIRIADNCAYNLIWTEGDERNFQTVERINLNRTKFIEIVRGWETKTPNNLKQKYSERLIDNCKRLEIKIATDYKEVLVILTRIMETLEIDDFDQVSDAVRDLKYKLTAANNTISRLRDQLAQENRGGEIIVQGEVQEKVRSRKWSRSR